MKVFVVRVIQIVALVTLTRADGGQNTMGKLGGVLTNVQGMAKDVIAGGNPIEAMKKHMIGLLDTDQDGSITAEEWKAVASTKGFPLAGVPWGNFLNASDANCDNKLTKDELGSFVSKVGQDDFVSKEKVGGDDTWDTNKDGKISKEEYIAYLSENQICAGCSLTAAVSTLGLVLMANIIF